MFTTAVRTLLNNYLALIGLISMRVQAHLSYGFEPAPKRLARLVGKAWRYAKAQAMDAIRAEAWRQIDAWEGLRSKPRARTPRQYCPPTEHRDRAPRLNLLPPLRTLTVMQKERLFAKRRDSFGPTYARIRKRIDLLLLLVDEAPEQQAKRLRRLGRTFARRLIKARLRKPPVIQPKPSDHPPPRRVLRPRVRLIASG